ncbi:MAG: hypothetical protein Q8M16_06340 [Pirellulaceae bacterium]|nr:hypothetical protein [Pirellulaceae bacterium]
MRFCKLRRLDGTTPMKVGGWSVVLCLLICSGCQNRPAGWRLLNFGRTERVPPPGTGSLNIPQFGPVLGTAPMGQTNPVGMSPTHPGAFYPSGTPIVNPGFSNPTIPPNVPGIGTSPWNTSTTGAGGGLGSVNPNTGLPTYSQIPDRGTATGVPGSAVAVNPTLGIDRTNVPSLLPGGFDPYDTSRIPTWSATGPSGFGTNALATTSSPTAPPGAQEGFWPGQLQSQGSPGNTGFGSGQWLRSVFGSRRLQPANLTGYATTAPIDNPMIPVTQGVNYLPQPMAGNYPVQPVAYVSQPVGTPGNGLSYARWREMQAAAQAQARQQAAWQQAQLMNQQMAQAAALRSGPGAGGYQVLAENSTSRAAENQNRFGWTTPPMSPGNPNYGAPPVMGSSGQAQPGQAPPMFRSSGQPLRTSDNNGLQTGWQANGVR